MKNGEPLSTQPYAWLCYRYLASVHPYTRSKFLKRKFTQGSTNSIWSREHEGHSPSHIGNQRSIFQVLSLGILTFIVWPLWGYTIQRDSFTHLAVPHSFPFISYLCAKLRPTIQEIIMSSSSKCRILHYFPFPIQ